MRILLYSPDSYGLGHVRRSISMAGSLLGHVNGASGLILTGAPRAHYFEYPSGCDYLKLPSMTKDDAGDYITRDLDMTSANTVRFREELIRLSVSRFNPDVLLVDHSPLGLGGEIKATLRHLAKNRSHTLRVLGMRDVIDEPERVKADWRRDGVYDVLRESYDRILVYGQRDLFDPIEAYAIPDDIARKITFVGYIPRTARPCPRDFKTRYAARTGRLVLVALGGGGDGNLLLRSFLEGFERLGERPDFEVVAVTGPLMSPRKRAQFKERAARLPGLTLLEYTDAMPDLIESSDFVVSMGGYNTVCELACAGARALIVPRRHPRKEQLVRARLLAGRGVVDCLDDDASDSRGLMDRVVAGLAAPAPTKGWGLDFKGLERSARALGPKQRRWTAAVASACGRVV
jgi:predicted glycosyltransferase